MEPLQVEIYEPRSIWHDLLGHTTASVKRFLIPSLLLTFLILFSSFLSLEFSFILGGGGTVSGTDAKGQGMNGIKIHDAKNT